MKKIVAVVPMKLNNVRLPNKNTRAFENGLPLCHYILETLGAINHLEAIYVYCSNPEIQQFLPPGIKYLPRPPEFDQDSARMNEILVAFADEVPAQFYLMAHTTAPFIKKESLEKGIQSVLSAEFDSAFSVKLLQEFLWVDDKPFNYSLDAIPRTQDLPPVFSETSGFYIYSRATIKEQHRRIGAKPCLVEVSPIEAIDIDEEVDFQIADAIYNRSIGRKNA